MLKKLLSRSPRTRILLLACWFVLLCTAADSNLPAQRPSSPKQSLAVDEVTLMTGKRMYGIVMHGNARIGLTMVVERSWFESTYPALYADHHKTERETAKVAQTKQLKRLEEWKTNRAADADLVKFIDEEIERTIKLQKDSQKAGLPDLKPFTLISYQATEINDVHIQPILQHHIAGCAWKHNLKRVTTRTYAALKRDLEKQQVDINKETFDLSSQLPGQHMQSDEEWSARVALFEYVLRKPLDFQGIGNNLMKIDSEKPPNVQNLLSQMLSGSLAPGIGQQGAGGLLDELLKELNLADNPGNNSRAEYKWWEPATKSAESDGFRGVRITRVVQDISSPLAKVENYFFAQLKPGDWKQIISVVATADRNLVDPDELAHLKADPQVEKVLTLFNGLGLGSDELIEIAIRQGAATDVARKDSEQRFFEILDRYTTHTDGPPLSVK